MLEPPGAPATISATVSTRVQARGVRVVWSIADTVRTATVPLAGRPARRGDPGLAPLGPDPEREAIIRCMPDALSVDPIDPRSAWNRWTVTRPNRPARAVPEPHRERGRTAPPRVLGGTLTLGATPAGSVLVWVNVSAFRDGWTVRGPFPGGPHARVMVRERFTRAPNAEAAARVWYGPTGVVVAADRAKPGRFRVALPPGHPSRADP